MRTINFYRTRAGRCPVEEFLDTLAAKQAQKVAWVLQFVNSEKFSPHVSTGVAPPDYLDKMLAEPFVPFFFSPAGSQRFINLVHSARLQRSSQSGICGPDPQSIR